MSQPQHIEDAIKLLWDYAEDACRSTWSKEELEQEGYGCATEYGDFVRFVFSKKEN